MLLARRALRPSSTSFPLSKIITLPITARFISTTTTTTPTNLKMPPNNNNHNNNNKDTLQEGGRGGGGEEPHQYQSGNRTDRPEDEWKFRAPYKIHDKGEDFQVKWRGKCHCGAVQYELSREKPLASKYCHCTTCQRMHGAPFQWAAIFHKSDINFTNGHHDLGWYDPTAKSTTHHLPCKVQCAYCRTPIMDEGRNMILLFPTLIEGINSPEGKKAFEVQNHMFYPQRVVDIKDGKPKFKGLADETNLVDEETGEEVVGSNPKEKEKRKREEEEGKDGENGEKGGKREKKEE